MNQRNIMSLIFLCIFAYFGCNAQDNKSNPQPPIQESAPNTATANVQNEAPAADTPQPDAQNEPNIIDNGDKAVAPAVEPDTQPPSNDDGSANDVADPQPEESPDAVAADDAQIAPVGQVPQDNGAFQPQGPLSDAQIAILDKITWDIPPEILDAILPENEGKHFLRSDEKHPDLFQESIQNLGGTYIGIGTDQGYLFVGWQRPSLAFLVDYDPWVVQTHKYYMIFWQACDDSGCLMDYFTDRDKAIAYLKGENGQKAGLDDKNSIKIYREAQRSVQRALQVIQRMKAKTFMNDPETFQYIKTLITEGRLRTYQANLLGDVAFTSMADALNRLGAKVSTLYLSNAEQYWGYTPQFKANMTGLPYADNALIMRTSATYPHNQDYRYSVQPANVFKAWLNNPDCKGVKHLSKRERVKAPDHFPFVVDDQMPPTANE